MRHLNSWYCHCSLLYYSFFLLLFSIIFYRWNRGWRQARGRRPLIKRLVASETPTPVDRHLPELERWTTKKCRPYIVRKPIRGFLILLFFFLLFLTRMPLNFSWPIPHSADCLHTASPPPSRLPWRLPGLAIRTLNIRDGRGFGMVQAIRAVECGGFDVMLLTDTKILLEAYLNNCLGYNVTCLVARLSSTRGEQVCVGLETMEMPVGWGVESTCYHSSNGVSCVIVTRLTFTPLVGAYLPPLTLEHLPDL